MTREDLITALRTTTHPQHFGALYPEFYSADLDECPMCVMGIVFLTAGAELVRSYSGMAYLNDRPYQPAKAIGLNAERLVEANDDRRLTFAQIADGIEQGVFDL